MPDTSLRHSRRVQRQSGKREWDTAYHEAGHAVAAFFLGMSIGRNGVTIVPDKIKQTLGTGHILSQLRERPDVSVSPRTHVQIENRAVMDMAGDVAEKKFRPTMVDRQTCCTLVICLAASRNRMRSPQLG
jgi:ATP-dependent Zn protease